MSIRMSPRALRPQGHACGPAEPDPRHPDGGAAVACGELCWRPPVVVVRPLKAAATGGGASGLGRRLHAVSLVHGTAASGAAEPAGGLLSPADFRRAVEMLPLVSIDLLLHDGQGRYLTGCAAIRRPRAPGSCPAGASARTSRWRWRWTASPARNWACTQWPPPDALRRPRAFYSTNFAGEINRSTHYIVLAYEAERALDPASLPHAQHRGYRWLSPAAIVADPDASLHPAYFRSTRHDQSLPYRAVILCGGSGSRLWPLSRELLPKQFIRLTDDRSLLQNTLLRLDSAGAQARPTLVCNEAHRYIAAEQAQELGIKDAELILEPHARNTAPAIAAATLAPCAAARTR